MSGSGIGIATGSFDIHCIVVVGEHALIYRPGIHAHVCVRARRRRESRPRLRYSLTEGSATSVLRQIMDSVPICLG